MERTPHNPHPNPLPDYREREQSDSGAVKVDVAPLSTVPRQLDYAQPPKWHKSARFRRATMWVFYLAVGTFAAVYGWRIAQQIQYLYWQRQCMNLARAPEYVVTEISRGRIGTWSPEWQRLTNGKLPDANRVGDLNVVPIVFMHSRFTTTTGKRLVVVYSDRAAFAVHKRLELCGLSLKPASIALGSRADGPWWSLSPLKLNAAPSLCLFAGQPDPADESHFTIQYELDGTKGIIDGWLMDNDSVKLEVRDGPLRDR